MSDRHCSYCAPDPCNEPIASIHWDFDVWGGKHHLKGSMEFDCRTQADELCEMLNKDYGEGTHWVVVHNMTREEMMNNE